MSQEETSDSWSSEAVDSLKASLSKHSTVTAYVPDCGSSEQRMLLGGKKKRADLGSLSVTRYLRRPQYGPVNNKTTSADLQGTARRYTDTGMTDRTIDNIEPSMARPSEHSSAFGP
ncbi:hypothetical protein MRX96_032817 [Rhipicephalus microplus]